MKKREIVVVGAGIAGLTSAAILSKLGFSVTLIESHYQSGGCAGTFKRQQYIFDVGATQVAGLEEEGIHRKIFDFLEIPVPDASILDPACVVDLNDGSRAIHIWYEEERWIKERDLQFPGSHKFWQLCAFIHTNNWKFANKNPVMPIRNFWDLSQLVKALTPLNLLSGFLIKSSMFDLLKLCGCHKDKRLIQFLNLQLKLYSQEDVYNTAALYGSTVLQMGQHPRGLFHLKHSMQALSNALEDSLKKTEAEIVFGQKVKSIKFDHSNKCWKVSASSNKKINEYLTKEIVYTLPPQSLLQHLDEDFEAIKKYKSQIRSLPKPTGALVFYSAIQRKKINQLTANHYQFSHQELGSLFISISNNGDGRAPLGEVTLIASIFTQTNDWIDLDKSSYLKKKEEFFLKISKAIEIQYAISSDDWLHRELATPLGFQRWTNRPNGIVGGLGQNPKIFGLLGIASRTPMKGLWLCGDSIYPGEGTAGVSQSALMVSRQIASANCLNNFTI